MAERLAVEPAIALRQLIFGSVTAQVVAVFARLALAERLSAPSSAAELAEATGADPDALSRLLRASSALGLVEEVAPGVVGLTPLGEWLRSRPPSLRDLAVAVAAPGHWRSIERLHETVMTGRPGAEQALGEGLWDYYGRHPEERAAFSAAMGHISELVGEELVRQVDVSPFRRVIDVGGSHGVVLSHVLGANPAATGMLFDRPEVVAGAHEELARRGVADRVEVVGGDFFEEVPGGGDLYLLKHILHDWDDERAGRILQCCHRAAPSGSTLLAVERLLDSQADPVAPLADLLMLVMFGGRERTREEYEALLGRAGYRLERVVPLSMLWVLEARRV